MLLLLKILTSVNMVTTTTTTTQQQLAKQKTLMFKVFKTKMHNVKTNFVKLDLCL